jgi:hypothetical protein
MVAGFTTTYGLFDWSTLFPPLIELHDTTEILLDFIMFNATFNTISAISWMTVFYWWRKTKYPEKTFELHTVTVKHKQHLARFDLKIRQGEYYSLVEKHSGMNLLLSK